jgi:hypothetical protein
MSKPIPAPHFEEVVLGFLSLMLTDTLKGPPSSWRQSFTPSQRMIANLLLALQMPTGSAD